MTHVELCILFAFNEYATAIDSHAWSVWNRQCTKLMYLTTVL